MFTVHLKLHVGGLLRFEIEKLQGLDFDPAQITADFNTEEIGHWRNYRAHLDPLRRALGDYAP